MRKLVGKNKIAISIVVVMCLILVFIGGKVFMEKREEKKEQELLSVEKQSVEVLKNTFENIKEVKIDRTGYNSMTGSYRMFVTMTNLENKSVYFSYGFVKDSGEIGSYGIEDRSVQVKGITKGKVKTIYSNGQGEEI